MKGNKILGLGIATGLLALSASAWSNNVLERIAIAVLAEKFGIDRSDVTTLQQQTRLPVYELSPILEGSHYFKQRPSTVWKLREEGLGWGQIAQRIGMHPGQFNKLRNQGAFDRDRFWTSSYRDRFGASDSQIAVVRKRGGTLEDVLGAIVIGKLTNKPPQDIYARYQTEKSWTTVASNQNVRFEQWKSVSVPVRNRYVLATSKTKSASGNRGFSKLEERDVAENQGKGKAGDNGKAKGKGDDKGKSKGKSKGKGKGG